MISIDIPTLVNLIGLQGCRSIPIVKLSIGLKGYRSIPFAQSNGLNFASVSVDTTCSMKEVEPCKCVSIGTYILLN